MIALCVDDENLLLKDLKRAVEKSPDIQYAAAFDDAIDAIEWSVDHEFDIAFLDVRLPVMSGVDLAAQLRRIRRDVPVIFCTGYRDYALEALQMHANGYLLKPIRPEKVQAEIDHVKRTLQGAGRLPLPESERTEEEQAGRSVGALLTVRPYGGFTVQDMEGKPVVFHRSKEKELFAALVYRQGVEISTDNLCDMLWTDNAWMYEKNRQYIYTLFSLLRRTLREVGAEAVLSRGTGGYGLDMSRILIDDSGRERLEYLPGFAWSR